MFVFEDIQDVEHWLEPMDYLGLWRAVAPYGVFDDADRDHCDGLIASSAVPPETILAGLKAMARIELTIRFDLSYRIYEPVDAQYVRMTH